VAVQSLALFIEYLNDALFIGLALLTWRQWRSRRDEPTSWVAMTFGILSVVVVMGLFLPEGNSDSLLLFWARKGLVIGLLAFPYALYRFAASFHPDGMRSRKPFAMLAGAVAVVTFALPDLPGVGEARPAWILWYVALVVLYWTALSATVAVGLWRAGQGKATVARRRMRLLAAGATVLNIALVLAAAIPAEQDATVASIIVGLLGTGSALLFSAGFAPPSVVKAVWRRREEAELERAQLRLMVATTPAEVVATLLPHGVAVVGARGGALFDENGRVVGAHGVPRTWAVAHAADTETLRLSLRRGELVLWAGPHTPYFGREETDLLRRFGIVIDLAWARCELLDSLRHTTAHLEEAQAIAHLGAYEFDVRRNVVTWSKEMYRIFGMDESEDPPTLENYLSLVHSDDRDAVAAAVTGALQTGQLDARDARVVTMQGDIRVLHTQIAATLDDDGTPIRIFGTVHDITQRKLAEEALSQSYEAERSAREAYERTNKELESFVYSVSHDLKSPIISVLGYLEYLKLDFGDLLPPVGLHYIERMSNSAAYMEALIQDLLELSRVGRATTDTAMVDLEEVAAQVVEELGPVHSSAHVRIGRLPAVWMSPLRARQVLTNLLDNALTHSGRPDVQVDIDAVALDGGDWEVTITDNGVGIPAQYREQVFGVFERLEGSDRHAGGTGIGLAICRKVMDTLGGRIAVADVEVGTRMSLRFPAELVRMMPVEQKAGF